MSDPFPVVNQDHLHDGYAERGTVRIAVLVSHPIQHFGPWFTKLASEKGVVLRVFYCTDWGLREYQDEGFGRRVSWDIPLLDGYEHEFLPMRSRPKSLGFLQIDNPSIANRLTSFDPSVLIVFGYAHRTHWRAALWSKANGIPLMLYSDSSITDRQTSNSNWWRRALVRKFYSYVDGCFSVGDNNRAYHLSFGVAPHRVFPGALPIDLSRMVESSSHLSRLEARTSMGIPRGAFLTTFVGKLIDRKRPQDVVRAHARVTDTRLWTLIVGDGPLMEPLKLEVGAQNLERIVFRGFVNQSELPVLYQASDCLVMTSEKDPHPLVITEAACFHLPIIASDRVGCIGPSDTVWPGENALVFPCGDADALAACMETLLKDPQLSARLGKASGQIAQTQDVVPVAANLARAAQTLVSLGATSKKQ